MNVVVMVSILVDCLDARAMMVVRAVASTDLP
jgi:hypothetical protein